jgi:hypothetical protein
MSFAAVHESAIGTKRLFAAVQQYSRSGMLSGPVTQADGTRHDGCWVETAQIYTEQRKAAD